MGHNSITATQLTVLISRLQNGDNPQLGQTAIFVISLVI
jgi:hypothetical protein